MRYLFLFLLVTLPLFTNPKDPYTLAVTEGEPSSLVEGIVSAITGDLYLSKADVIVQGSVPLRMPRNYISGDGYGTYAGWVFLDYLEAKYEARGSSSNHFITIKDPNGTIFSYQGSGNEVSERYERTLTRHRKNIPLTVFSPLDPSQMPGFTNAGQGRISALTNLKNAKVYLDPNGIYFHLGCPDGTHRIYKRAEEPENFRQLMNGYETGSMDYLLQVEELPSGNVIYYNYDDKNRVHLIRTTNVKNNKTYTSARIEYLDDDYRSDFDVYTSDNKKIEYRFKRRSHRNQSCHLLATINSTEFSPESYQYHEDHDYCGFLVSKRAAVGNRFYNIDYYRPKKNNVGQDIVQLQKHGDPRCLRVKTLSAPVGPNATPLITHRFFYHPESRYTDVREIDNTLTRYQYTPEMRLEYLRRFGKADALSNYERFVWGTDGSLLCRTFFDSANKPLFSRRFVYDERGNVLQEKQYGDLSGESKDPLTIGADGFPTENGAEVQVIQRHYSQDGRNLLLREEEPSGKVTLYTYHDKYSLLTSKFICDRDQIKIRYFYEYNDDLVVVREAMDDGSSSDPNNLTGVKIRHIKDITPSDQGPYLNMPKVIEEKYSDGTEEILLKKIVLTYTHGGLIAQKDIYDARGVFCYSLKTKYNVQGHPIEEVDAEGNTTKHDYDALGNKIFSQESSGKYSNVMTYDCSNRLTKLEEVGFDGTKKATEFHYDTKHNKTATIDPLGNETRYVYDSFGNVIETHLPPIADPAGKIIYPILRTAYDDAGREISRTDANGNTTRTEYNSRNQVTRISHPDGTHEEFFYYLDGSLKTHVDQCGVASTFTYDFLGRPTSKTISSNNEILLTETSSYDAFNLICTTDAEGHETYYTYDGAGRKIAEERCGERTEYFYDDLGRLSSTKKGELVSITKYDILDRVIEERQEDTQGNLLTSIRYGYDSAGNKSCITRDIAGKEATEALLYDAFHRLIQKADALGHITTISYMEPFSTPLGNVLRTILIDPLGLQTLQTYNTLGQLAETAKKNAFGETLSLEKLYYDANGNLTHQISTIFNPDSTSRDVTIFREYGTMNRLLSLIEAPGTPDQKITRYSYTAKGFLHHTTKPDQVVLENTYDPLGRLIELTSSDGSIHYTYLYNKLGEPIESTDQIHQTTTKRDYDAFGRLLYEKLVHGHSLSSVFNEVGQRTELHLPDQSVIRYEHDPLFLRSVKWKDFTHTYTYYDRNGALLQEELPSNLGSVTYTFDPLGRKSSLTSLFHSHHILAYDPVGNIRHMEQNGQEYAFSYDGLYQISREKTHQYTHDSLGNRTLKDAELYQINNLNQDISHFQYDLNGNPITKNTTHYTYDALDRLIEIQTPTSRLLFTYDSYHRRISKTVFALHQQKWKKQSEIFFLYDDQKEMGSVDAAGNLIDLRILRDTSSSERGSAVLFLLRGKPYIPLYDLFGNVERLLTPGGVLVESYQYTAFGEEAIFGPAGNPLSHSINPWRYCSKRTDDETHLVFFGRRYYDPSLGRWLTPDPAGFTDGANLYAFVRNNPFSFLDLFGLSIEDYYGTTTSQVTRLRSEQDICCFGNVRTCNQDLSSSLTDTLGYNSFRSNTRQVDFSRDDSSGNSLYSQGLVSSNETSLRSSRSVTLTDSRTPCGHQGSSFFSMFEFNTDSCLRAENIIKAVCQMLEFLLGTEIPMLNQEPGLLGGCRTGTPPFPMAGRAAKALGFTNSLERRAFTYVGRKLGIVSAERGILNGKQIWSSTKERTGLQNAYLHWRDHFREFPEIANAKKYVERTIDFVNNPPPGTLFKIRANGDVILYNPSTNVFAIRNQNGLPKTMYKPNVNKHPYSTNLDYFNAQR